VRFFNQIEALKHPGPQRQILRSLLRLSPLRMLIVAFLTVIALQLTEYYGLISGSHRSPFPLSIDKTITILCSLLALSFAVKSFALSVRPILSYEYLNPKGSSMSLTGDTFQVLLKNSGPGMGIVTGSKYLLKLRETETVIASEDPIAILDHLQTAGLFREVNFDIFLMRPGYSIGSKESRTLFEIHPGEAIKLERLDIRLRVRSVLGDEYEKWLFCIPRDFSVSLPLNQIATSH
jgi:hypothetical protein